jgi:hypothetical protein
MTTEVILSTQYDTVIVDDQVDTILVESDGLTTVITSAEQGPPGPAGIQNISDAFDVDASNRVSGSILVYSAPDQKWVATTLLENQTFESGHY